MLTVELYLDKKKQFRTRIKARNGKVVFDSAEGYKRRQGALNGLHCVLAAEGNGVEYNFVDLTGK